MTVYNASNIPDHPVEHLPDSIGALQQQIDQLKTTAKYHKYISFVKSAIRIAAGMALIWPGSLVLAGTFIIAAEVLGVVEEIV